MDRTHKSGWLQRLGLPPERLKPVSGRLKLPVRLFWWACLALAIIAQAGGIWRGQVDAVQIEPRFATLGLTTHYPDDEIGVEISPASERALAAGVPERGRIIAIEGRPVAHAASAEVVSELLAAAAGGEVRVTIRPSEGEARQIALARAADPSAGTRALTYWTVTGVGLIGVLVLLVAAVLLILRRPDDPVSLLLSLSFVCAIGFLRAPLDFYEWIGADWLGSVIPSIWLGLLVAALPAFPDGRFVPRWGGWLAVFAIPYTALIVLDDVSEAMTAIVGFGVAALAVATPLIRYRRTPPGQERQQLKWAALGFAGSIGLLALTFGMFTAIEFGLVPEAIHAPLALFLSAALHVSFILLPVGVLISLLRYRLWDADRAIGRSSAFGIVAVLLGGAWAGIQEVVKVVLASTEAGLDATTLAGLSTATVAILFPPVQSRVERWTERRLQGPIARMHELPEQWAAQSQTTDPETLALRAFEEIAGAAVAVSGDVWLAQDGSWRRLAIRGEGEDFAPLDRDEGAASDAAVVHVVDARVAQIRLGARPDGSRFPRDMRRVLDTLGEPLAAALETALDRAHHRRAIEAIHLRLDRIEAQIDGNVTAA